MEETEILEDVLKHEKVLQVAMGIVLRGCILSEAADPPSPDQASRCRTYHQLESKLRFKGFDSQHVCARADDNVLLIAQNSYKL